MKKVVPGTVAISSLDHSVLIVSNVEASCRFYATPLGMEIVTFGEIERPPVLAARRSIFIKSVNSYQTLRPIPLLDLQTYVYCQKILLRTGLAISRSQRSISN